MHKYKELEVWKKSIALTKRIYLITSSFPSEEKFGLKSQINRAAVSIASNIAEGAGRNSNKEFNQFLGIAIGSMHEVETQIIISFEVGFIEETVKDEICDQISQLILMTKGLKNHLV
ncbi:four helix bundle protein [Roseivirga sp. E12]|uniref:four helix bundle protein n=1 Tax=Roseivirga sp. E12 TaxID=2819237 RepID=UPI001ABCF822|nr:four helix bundle protein [Roseivirga sp. E12]MBO3699462.1 four helix bundle protein [Roseivirga sp. E12]